MPSVDLYRAVGGLEVCRQLSEAFYARLERDPVLRPLFPGKSLRCAVDAFAAFLAQFLGGPAEHAQDRWWLSLRESHLRFRIGLREQQAWMSCMAETLAEAPLDDHMRLALRDLFERSSTYLVNTGESMREPGSRNFTDDPIHAELTQRWVEQQELDNLIAALGARDAGRALALMRTPPLQTRFARDRAVLAHALGLMIACGEDALLDQVEREVVADPALARIRNRHGRTLLHDASAHANLRIVELLLRLGADPDDGVPSGRTPLYCLVNECAAGGGSIVHALVRAGAKVNLPVGVKRCTALHMAARRGNTEIAEALLDCGADLCARDSSGDTPLQRAKNCRKHAVAALLASRAHPEK